MFGSLNLGGLGLPYRGAAGSAAAWEQILTLAAAGGWTAVYDPTNPDTRTLRESGGDNYLAAESDGLGNLPDAVMATEADQPLLAPGYFGALDALDLRSGARRLETSVFTTITQPFMIIAVVETTAPLSGTSDFAFSGRDGSNASAYGLKRSTDLWAIGSPNIVQDTTADANPHILAGIFNGGASRLYLDNLLRAELNAGASNIDRIILGALLGGGASSWPGWVGTYALFDGNNETKLLDMGSLLHTLTTIPEAS